MLTLMGVSVAVISQAETAHQHGVADLNIAMSKNNLMIELHTPADNIVGFEFMPKTDQQKQTLSHSLSLLKTPSALFEIPKQAQCNLQQTQIDNPFEPEKVAVNDHKQHDQQDKHETHRDVEIQYSYHCQQPRHLTNLKTNGLFQHFPNFITLKVQWLNDSQQSATIVSKEAAAVSFQP